MPLEPSQIVPASKFIFKSKTALLAAAVAVVGALDSTGAADFVSANPRMSLLAVGALFTGLRLVTKGRVHLWRSPA